MSSQNSRKLNILYLTENLYDYKSSDYQIDFIQNLKKFFKLFEYGPGYKNYDINLDIDSIQNKLSTKFDILFLGHSVLSDTKKFHYDNYYKVISSNNKIPTAIFLNKEYVNLKKKLKFIKDNKINIVFSHHHVSKFLNKFLDKKFKFIPFATTLDKHVVQSYKKYDLNFVGILKNLNKKYRHTNTREILRNEIFFKIFNINLLKKKNFKKYKIFWMNHPRNKFELLLSKLTNYKRLSREEYLNIISQSWLTFNTPSPYNIIGPRYYDALALGSPILCPKNNFYNHYFDNEDLIQFESMYDFNRKLEYYLKDKSYLENFSNKLKQKYSSHNYYYRSKDIYSHIMKI